MNKYYSTANNKKFILLLKIACVKQMERDDMKRNEIKQTNKQKAADPRPLVPFIETVDICWWRSIKILTESCSLAEGGWSVDGGSVTKEWESLNRSIIGSGGQCDEKNVEKQIDKTVHSGKNMNHYFHMFT